MTVVVRRRAAPTSAPARPATLCCEHCGGAFFYRHHRSDGEQVWKLYATSRLLVLRADGWLETNCRKCGRSTPLFEVATVLEQLVQTEGVHR